MHPTNTNTPFVHVQRMRRSSITANSSRVSESASLKITSEADKSRNISLSSVRVQRINPSKATMDEVSDYSFDSFTNVHRTSTTLIY